MSDHSFAVSDLLLRFPILNDQAVERAIGVLIGLGHLELAERIDTNSDAIGYYKRQEIQQNETLQSDGANTTRPFDNDFVTAEIAYEAIEREKPELHIERRAILAEVSAIAATFESQNSYTDIDRRAPI